MYAHFYHLAENPFNLTPDPKFHYINESTREAMASILHGIQARKGFISLIGEAGTGKTTLLKRVVEEIEGESLVVFVFNPGVSFDELLEFICAELGIGTESRRRLTLLDRLNDFLLDRLTEGRNVVVMIDEAQTLEESVLEELRLLSNLETSKEKILQILLAGQPELEDKLRRPTLRQLRQRIAVRATLKPMRPDEIGPYVNTRLRSAGADREDFFTPAALRKIWHASQGIPRVINVICDNAMMIAFADGKHRITGPVATEAVRDLHGATVSTGLLERMRAWAMEPTVRYAAASLVGLALVLPLALSLVDGRSTDDLPATSSIAPPAAPVVAPAAAVSAGQDPAALSVVLPFERADAAPPPVGAGATTTPRLLPSEPASAEIAVIVPVAEVPEPSGARTAPAAPLPAEPVDTLVENNDAVLDSIRRAEVLARSTAARLFDGRRTSIEESAAREIGAAALRPSATPSRQGIERDVAGPKPGSASTAVGDGRRDERLSVASAGMVSANETLAGSDADLAEPLDALAGPVEPLVTASATDPQTPRKGRWLGPRDGEPVVGHLVRVLPGDTVWDIAVAHYGSAGPVTLKRILNSNPLVRDPRNLEAGSHIYLPFQRPDQMVRAADNGTYHVIIAIAPQQTRLEQVREWVKSFVPGVELTTVTASGGGEGGYQLQIVGVASRDAALGLASDILAEYGRTRLSGTFAAHA